MASSRISSLKTKSDFRELALRGRKSKSAGWLTLDYIVAPTKADEGSAGSLKYGLSISRRIGSAVIRNKIKRWSREFFRKVSRAQIATLDIRLNLRLRENGDFYKHIRRSQFDEVLEQAWVQIKKSL